MRRVSCKWLDFFGNTGVFSFNIADAYDDGVYAELLAFLQDLVDASSAELTDVQIITPVPITSLTSNAAANTGTYDRIGDQAVLAWRSAANEDVKLSIPAPELGIFDATGAFAEADVNELATEIAALIATGETVPLLVTKSDAPVAYRKGWRKGQKHS